MVTALDPLFDLISFKLTGHQIPETLTAIDQLWKATGSKRPISRVFLEEQKEHLSPLGRKRDRQRELAMNRLAEMLLPRVPLEALYVMQTELEGTKPDSRAKDAETERAEAARYLGALSSSVDPTDP